jgi:hypothetical protein
MLSWFGRLTLRMIGVLLLMLVVELASFLAYREYGLNRLWWLPLSFGLVAFAGYDTVRRLPLVWGGVIGALLAGIGNVLEWPTGAWVADGRFQFPPEAEPLLIGTSLLIAVVVGAIVGAAAGAVARGRRRIRSRRTAMGKLAYEAYDEQPDPDGEVRPAIAIPMAEPRDRR